MRSPLTTAAAAKAAKAEGSGTATVPPASGTILLTASALALANCVAFFVDAKL